ncbi:MAG: hypothetical protein ACOY5F_03355 [Pseudomonadota bacterium]
MAKASRSTLVMAALCAALGLSGCANGNFDLDPATWFPDGKKKLPGERRELFPEGVPGVTQGIPPELIRGNPAQQAAQDPALAPAQDQQQGEQQAQDKPKPRPKKVARPRPAPAPEPEPDAEPAPRASQSAPRQAQPASSGAWPAPQAQQQQQQAPAAGAWPAPPAAGTFTR